MKNGQQTINSINNFFNNNLTEANRKKHTKSVKVRKQKPATYVCVCVMSEGWEGYKLKLPDNTEENNNTQATTEDGWTECE